MVSATCGDSWRVSLLEPYAVNGGGCPLSQAPSCQTAGHQFTSSSLTERRAGAAAELSDKLQPTNLQPCSLEDPRTCVNHTGES